MFANGHPRPLRIDHQLPWWHATALYIRQHSLDCSAAFSAPHWHATQTPRVHPNDRRKQQLILHDEPRLWHRFEDHHNIKKRLMLCRHKHRTTRHLSTHLGPDPHKPARRPNGPTGISFTCCHCAFGRQQGPREKHNPHRKHHNCILNHIDDRHHPLKRQAHQANSPNVRRAAAPVARYATAPASGGIRANNAQAIPWNPSPVRNPPLS
mmetsp:Transcript_24188/g.45030  ORF Transcript_24188/g.45030 Transcript_24188/m.45030 type:complete len:209 (+) Transcript_24188:1118-1744(+)